MYSTYVIICLVAVLIAVTSGLDHDSLAAPQAIGRRSPAAAADVTFTLHTRGLEDSSSMDASKPTVVVVPSWTHGNLQRQQQAYLDAMVDALLRRDDINVFTVDWSAVLPVAATYDDAVQGSKAAAQQLGAFITGLKKSKELDTSSLQLIGYSMGAHIAGAASQHVDSQIDRITGLDPAGPYFDAPGRDLSEILDSTDAALVDIIHTNTWATPVGDVDLYANGGHEQPNCWGASQDACSSLRAVEIYTEALNTDEDALAYACDRYDKFLNGDCLENEENIIGANVNRSNTGVFHFLTNGEKPLLVDLVQLTVELKKPMRSGQIYIKVSGKNMDTVTVPMFDKGLDTGKELMGMAMVSLGVAPEDLVIEANYRGFNIFLSLPRRIIRMKIAIIRKIKRKIMKLIRCKIWLLTNFNIIKFFLFLSPC